MRVRIKMIFFIGLFQWNLNKIDELNCLGFIEQLFTLKLKYRILILTFLSKHVDFNTQ